MIVFRFQAIFLGLCSAASLACAYANILPLFRKKLCKNDVLYVCTKEPKSSIFWHPKTQKYLSTRRLILALIVCPVNPRQK
jgi:hypothetical protein